MTEDQWIERDIDDPLFEDEDDREEEDELKHDIWREFEDL